MITLADIDNMFPQTRDGSIYSDLHKDAYGFRPRGELAMFKDIADFDEAWKRAADALEREVERDVRSLRLGPLRLTRPQARRMAARLADWAYYGAPGDARALRLTVDVYLKRLMEPGMPLQESQVYMSHAAEARARLALARQLLPAGSVNGRYTAHHLWLVLPEPWRQEEFVLAVRQRGVAITGADVFAVGRVTVPHAVRLGLCTPASRDDVARALMVLSETLSQHVGSSLMIV